MNPRRFSSLPRFGLLLWLLSAACLVPILARGAEFASGGLQQLGDSAARFLPVDQAFQLRVAALDAGRLQVEWVMEPGYYLYRHRLEFKAAEGASLGPPEIPAGKPKTDEYFGEVEVYYGVLQIPMAYQATAESFELVVGYQGCADAGLCYPPERKHFEVRPAALQVTAISTPGRAASPAAAPAPELTEEGRLARVIKERNLAVTLLLFLLAGIGLAFTPCVLPMLPILSSIVLGRKQTPSAFQAFMLSLAYVGGMAVTYAILGSLVGQFGAELNLQAQLQSPWVLGAFALLFGLLALSMFGFYELQLPAFLRDAVQGLNERQQGGGYLGVILMGVLSSLVVSPCVSAPLAGALIYISSTGDALLGGLVLLALGLGMGIPLIVVATGGRQLLPRTGQWMVAVRNLFGVLLLAVAIWMLERVIPPPLTLALWGTLLIVSGVYLGALEPAAGGWSRWWKGLGLVLLLYGGLLLAGAAAGGGDPLRPLGGLGGPAVAPKSTSFARVTTARELEAAMAATQGPALVDFYADWCIACKVMERQVFNAAELQPLLGRFNLVQVDLTENSPEGRAILQTYGLFGPPAMLFFDAGRRELQAFRVQGEMDAAALRSHLEQVLAKVGDQA